MKIPWCWLWSYSQKTKAKVKEYRSVRRSDGYVLDKWCRNQTAKQIQKCKTKLLIRRFFRRLIMKKYWRKLHLVSLIGLFSCGRGENSKLDGKIAVSGKIENAPWGYVVLSSLQDTRPRLVRWLSKNGNLAIEVTVDVPNISMILNLFGEKSVRLALDKEDVKWFTISKIQESLEITRFSKTPKEMVKIDKLRLDYQAKVKQINEGLYEAMRGGGGGVGGGQSASKQSDAIKQIQVDRWNYAESWSVE